MFIRNKRIYLISLLISCIGTAIFWVVSFFLRTSSVWDTIISIILLIAAIAGVLCGSLSVYWSIVKASFHKSDIVFLSPVGIVVHLFLKLLLIVCAIGIGLILCLAIPGVYALIAWYRHRDELED